MSSLSISRELTLWAYDEMHKGCRFKSMKLSRIANKYYKIFINNYRRLPMKW